MIVLVIMVFQFICAVRWKGQWRRTVASGCFEAVARADNERGRSNRLSASELAEISGYFPVYLAFSAVDVSLPEYNEGKIGGVTHEVGEERLLGNCKG